jgi:hypothetical protein
VVVDVSLSTATHKDEHQPTTHAVSYRRVLLDLQQQFYFIQLCSSLPSADFRLVDPRHQRQDHGLAAAMIDDVIGAPQLVSLGARRRDAARVVDTHWRSKVRITVP